MIDWVKLEKWFPFLKLRWSKDNFGDHDLYFNGIMIGFYDILRHTYCLYDYKVYYDKTDFLENMINYLIFKKFY